MKAKIQFICSKPINYFGTVQLRCLQPAEYLKAIDWDVEVCNIKEATPIKSGIIFFHRTAYDRFTKAFGKYAKSLGNIIIYDTDDLTFDESSDNGHFLELCDAVTVSTEYLQKRLPTTIENSYVIRNALTNKYLNIANSIYEERKNYQTKFVTIAYLSGSKTHDKDFLVIQDTLLNLLDNNSSVKIILAGKLKFSDKFFNFGDRFIYHEFMPYYDYINLYKQVDINLAPLDIYSEFAHGRSELKYMEAGACGIPTVASPTDTYKRIINHGINGFLAEQMEWQSILQSLIENKALRNSIGSVARKQILKNYDPALRAKQLEGVIRQISNQKSLLEPKLYISFFYSILSYFYLYQKQSFSRKVLRELINKLRSNIIK